MLDLGCGTGDLANKLHNLGTHVIGIDKSENMIHQARRKYPHINFMIYDVLDIEFTDEFDAVFSNATLHWVKSPKQALNRIFTFLKPKGDL
ncbi:class I SAM-dependent methyltransferase [Bacillus sp. FJAT-47783]|uniref:class I SAM-dependent methyltransferase n=1 Tax=Bacillus sp. FJAT-47783 TaxID=2922712 RepID=UPI00325FA82F